MLNKIRILFSLDMKTRLLFIETLFFLGLARLLICIPFSKITNNLGIYMQETPNINKHKNLDELRNIRHALKVISNHTFWESKCLVRAIAAMKMLERREIESTLYLGTRKDSEGKMIAHAWLRSGAFYVTGGEGMEQFTVVGKFAKQISSND